MSNYHTAAIPFLTGLAVALWCVLVTPAAAFFTDQERSAENQWQGAVVDLTLRAPTPLVAPGSFALGKHTASLDLYYRLAVDPASVTGCGDVTLTLVGPNSTTTALVGDFPATDSTRLGDWSLQAERGDESLLPECRFTLVAQAWAVDSPERGFSDTSDLQVVVPAQVESVVLETPPIIAPSALTAASLVVSPEPTIEPAAPREEVPVLANSEEQSADPVAEIAPEEPEESSEESEGQSIGDTTSPTEIESPDTTPEAAAVTDVANELVDETVHQTEAGDESNTSNETPENAPEDVPVAKPEEAPEQPEETLLESESDEVIETETGPVTTESLPKPDADDTSAEVSLDTPASKPEEEVTPETEAETTV